MIEICTYCHEPRNDRIGCCGENHWEEVPCDSEYHSVADVMIETIQITGNVTYQNGTERWFEQRSNALSDETISMILKDLSNYFNKENQ